MSRAAVAVVAVVVLGWLGLMERDARLQAQGVAEAGRGERVEAAADLRAARLLNPDTAPDLALALVYRADDQDDRGIAVVEDVLRREPENLTAWGVLHQIGRPDLQRRALAARERLDPLSARR